MTPGSDDNLDSQNVLRKLDDALAHMQQAAQLLTQGRSFEALRLAEQAAASLPKTPGMHYLRSICLKAMERHTDALEAAKIELEINPGHQESVALVEELTAIVRTREKPVRGPIPTAERPWNTELARDSLLSIQDAIGNYTYRGISMVKNPFDFALYPKLLWELQPLTIIEIGSSAGGSAVWFGDMFNTFRIDGHVYSIDIIKVESLAHSRVTFMEGDARNLKGVFTDTFLKELPRPLLVVEDADHAYETSYPVLEFFHRHLVSGEYIVIEDGINSDLYGDSPGSSGPHRAIRDFLENHKGEYEMDAAYCDFFGYNFTWCSNGFLKRI